MQLLFDGDYTCYDNRDLFIISDMNENLFTKKNNFNLEDWNEDIAKVIAGQEEVELTDRHWDVINYLRDEFINNNSIFVLTKSNI